MPRSAATCAIGRPLSSANLTPRSSNSSGYFLGLDLTAEDLLSPGQHPGSEVPAKPGPAHPGPNTRVSTAQGRTSRFASAGIAEIIQCPVAGPTFAAAPLSSCGTVGASATRDASTMGLPPPVTGSAAFTRRSP